MLAQQNDIPLIIDNAYGMPFPNIIFKKVGAPEWQDNIIFVNSLSKLGLPGTRTAIIIGNTEIISALKSINAIVALAPSNMGQRIMLTLLADGSVTKLANTIVHPFYEKKSKNALTFAHTVFNSSVPYYFHENEGSIFLWLWVKGLPISSYELYQRLKAKGVIVVPGNFFFPGVGDTNWSHTQECLRISYIPDEKIVQKGLKIIAHEINALF
jgi:valine--pyruvate aminotransferase